MNSYKVSHVLFLKRGAAIYLSVLQIPKPISVSFISFRLPYRIWVSRLRGLPRSTLPVSRQHRHCGTFKAFHP